LDEGLAAELAHRDTVFRLVGCAPRVRGTSAFAVISSAGRPRVALVLWDGAFGGTELLYAGLAAAMRRMGVDAEIVFVASAGPLAARLEESGVPFRCLDLARGRDVLRRPRRFAAAVRASGADGAILPERGFIGCALRLGGYRGPIVAVEHGALILTGLSVPRRGLKLLNTLAGALADDVEVGVSDFMVGRMRALPHARCLRRIYNGIDPARFTPNASPMPVQPGEPLVAAVAARLIAGKGVDDAIAALAVARRRSAIRLRIAGDGPEREALDALITRLGVRDDVELLGLVKDMPGFWRSCDVALFPSHQFIESFGLAAVEAMASAKPVIATRNGAVGELVADGVTGTMVAPGDVSALADGLVAYAQRPDLRRAHGEAGRARVLERFDIDVAARQYLECLGIKSARP
jgi:glycosyltransferase involved in cell wall biosynthesis